MYIVFLVGMSTAPLVFGFLILIPYLGPAIGKVLSVWQLLIMTTAVEYAFQVGFIQAAVCVGLSWLLMLLLSNTIGRPVVALRNLIYRKVTGSDLDSTTQDILLEYSGGQELVEKMAKEDIWHLYGSKDQLQALGGKLFAGRWRVKPHSPWNRARRAGRITMLPLGAFKHNGVCNYFDMATMLPDETRTYGQKTLDTIEQVLAEAKLLRTHQSATGES